jgi:hypothetical protein
MTHPFIRLVGAFILMTTTAGANLLPGGGPAVQGPDISISQHDIDRIKTTDYIEISGTNDLGGAENFTIHNTKAIAQFVGFLTSDRFTAVPKSHKLHFKSLSSYKIRLSAKGSTVLEFQLIGDSALDIPGETEFYVESDRYSDNLMAPLLRLR